MNFTLQRCMQLIKNELSFNKKPIIISAITLLLFLTLMPFFSLSIDTYLLVLYVGGFIITSRIFNDVHDPQRAYLYLTLPCSNLERFVSKWFLSSIGFGLALLVLFFICSLIFMLLHPGLKTAFPIARTALWWGMCKYFILQSTILLGAITFKSFALIKTLLVALCFVIVMSLFSFLIGVLVFFPHHLPAGLAMIEVSTQGLNFIFWIIMAPIFWYITYLRLTEYELK